MIIEAAAVRIKRNPRFHRVKDLRKPAFRCGYSAA